MTMDLGTVLGHTLTDIEVKWWPFMVNQ